MLKKIPNIISPDLMQCMMEMGHGDFMIFADANYPAHSNAQYIIRLDGVEVDELLEAVMPFFPLDNFVDEPVHVMSPRDDEPTPEIWARYKEILLANNEEGAFRDFGFWERMDFYERSRDAYVIVQTATTKRYANIVLQKGVI